jgi:hypothetical protein
MADIDHAMKQDDVAPPSSQDMPMPDVSEPQSVAAEPQQEHHVTTAVLEKEQREPIHVLPKKPQASASTSAKRQLTPKQSPLDSAPKKSKVVSFQSRLSAPVAMASSPSSSVHPQLSSALMSTPEQPPAQPQASSSSTPLSLWKSIEEHWFGDVLVPPTQEDAELMEMAAIEERIRILQTRLSALKRQRERRESERQQLRASQADPLLSALMHSMQSEDEGY